MENNRVIKHISEFDLYDWKAFEEKLKEKTELYNDVMFSINEDFKCMYEYLSQIDKNWSITNITYKDNKLPLKPDKLDKSKVIIEGLKYKSKWIPENIGIVSDNISSKKNDLYIIGIYSIICINKEFAINTPLLQILSINGFIVYDNRNFDDLVFQPFSCIDYNKFCEKLKTKEYTSIYPQKILDELQTYVRNVYGELYKTYEEFIYKMYTIFDVYLNVIALHGEEFRNHMIKYNWNIEFDNYGKVIRKL